MSVRGSQYFMLMPLLCPHKAREGLGEGGMCAPPAYKLSPAPVTPFVCDRKKESKRVMLFRRSHIFFVQF